MRDGGPICSRHGLPAVTYDPRSRGAEAYFAFTEELLAKNLEAVKT